jgi:hypothetical protein
MPEMAITIAELAAHPIWDDVKMAGEVVLQIDGRLSSVAVVRGGGIGMFFFECVCGRRCQELWLRHEDGLLACRLCCGALHIDSQLPGSPWSRAVQVNKLEKGDFDRNARRRARRRQQRLLTSIKQTLDQRIVRLEEQVRHLARDVAPT